MASPELAIAKAALSASLFRADPTSLSRPEVEAFFPLLSSTLHECSRPNVQKCKVWMVDNVAHSQARTAALAKFFSALSKSLTKTNDGEKKQPGVKRQRLHLLYALNDVLYQVITRNGERAFSALWERAIPGLFALAAAFDNCPKHKKKLESLVGIWAEKGYFPQEVISQLRDAISRGAAVETSSSDPEPPMTSLKLAKNSPYILPSFHGDSATSWYDLPAGTWLPHIIPNSTKPMQPSLIRPLQLKAGPADKKLADAVQSLLLDAEQIYPNGDTLDDGLGRTRFNELGERVILDEVSGDVIDGDTYYGWSRRFCERMKTRRKGVSTPGRGRSRSRTSSRSGTPSRASSARSPKRRRVASRSTMERSRSGSRGRSRSRSQRRGFDQRGYSRSRSRGRNHSRSNSRPRHQQRSYSRSRSRSSLGSRSHSQTRSHSISKSSHQPPHSNPGQQYQTYPNAPPPFPPNLPAQHLANNFQHMPPHIAGGFPIPPPPPAGYEGAWPPPPPPPPLPYQGQQPSPPQGWFPNSGIMPSNIATQWNSANPPPPPPPVPSQHPSHHSSNEHYGRGNGGYRGRGHGGYDRGRGRRW